METRDFVLDLLEKNSYEAFLVGGFVRDKLLGFESNDVDITTSARPKEILDVFKNYKCIEVGKKFGTIKVFVRGEEFEITTFRKESGYIDKRHPKKIEFSNSIFEDLERRDFTINAMAMRKDLILDPFLGQKDLKNKIIRAVGDPNKRIKEDSLRSLRAVRFATSLGFSIDPSLKKAIIENKDDIKFLSVERIAQEINKILLSDRPDRGIRLLEELELLEEIFPEVYDMIGFDQKSSHHDLDLYNHSLKVLSLVEKDLTTRLAALYHDTGKPATMFIDENGEGRFFGHQEKSQVLLDHRLKSLKYPKKIINDAGLLIRRHMDNANIYTKKSVRKLIRNIGLENLYRLFDLQEADILSSKSKDRSNIENGRRILKEILENKNDDFLQIAINGNDLKELGFKESKELGDLLREVENLVFEEKLTNEKDKIIEYIKNKYIAID